MAGGDWILRFSVHGDDRWLTAEREDGSQRLEAPNAQVLVDAVQLLDDAAAGPADNVPALRDE